MSEADTADRRYTMSGKKLPTPSFHHITLDDRIIIQEILDQGTRLKDLAGQIAIALSFNRWLLRSRLAVICSGTRRGRMPAKTGYTVWETDRVCYERAC